jgi:hypothetical protein
LLSRNTFAKIRGIALHKNKENREKFRWLIVNSQLLILNCLTKDTEHQFRIYNLQFTIFPFFIFVQSLAAIRLKKKFYVFSPSEAGNQL